MGNGAADDAVQQPAIQDQRLKTRVCDKIVYCVNWQTDFANLIIPTCHIASTLQSGTLQTRKTTRVDLRSYNFAREGIVVFCR